MEPYPTKNDLIKLHYKAKIVINIKVKTFQNINISTINKK